MLGSEIKRELGDDTYYENVAISPDALVANNRALRDIARRNKELDATHNVASQVLEANNIMIDGVIGLGIAAAPATGGSSLVLSGLAWAGSEGLESVANLFEETNRTASRRHLKTLLEDYRRQRGNSAYDNLLQTGNTEAFRKQLEADLGPIFGDALDSVDPGKRDIVNSAFNKVIAQTMQDGFESLANVQALQQSEIDQNTKNIVGLSQSFADFADKTAERLENIQSAQDELRSGLEDMQERMGQTERGVANVQKYLFSTMSPERQLAALRQGWFSGMDDADREALEKEIELVKKRKEFEENVASYLKGAGELYNIASNLGVEGPFMEDAAKAIQIGNSAFNAYTAFATGNVLGGISAASSIFGGSGRDAGAERHAQLVRLLQGLYGRLDVIERKVDALIEGQQRIVENQQRIYGALIDISEKLSENHQEVMNKLQDIHDDILYNRKIILNDVKTDYGQCTDLIYYPGMGRREADSAVAQIIKKDPEKLLISTAQGVYPQISDPNSFIQKLNRDYKPTITTCLNILDELQSVSGEFSSLFWLETHEKSRVGGTRTYVDSYIDSTYSPVLSLLYSSQFLEDHPLDSRIGSLLIPTNSINTLSRKLTKPVTGWESHFAKDQAVGSAESLMQRLLAPAVVKWHVDYVLDLHFYNMLFYQSNNSYELHTVEELIDQAEPSERGFTWLRRAMYLTDIAIAQQNLLGGDVLLPIISEVFDRQNSDTSNEQKQRFGLAELALKSNVILAQNFVMYKLRQEVTSKSNFATYSVAVGVPDDPYLLNQITSYPWDFQWCGEGEACRKNQEGSFQQKPFGWSIRIGENYYELPSTEDLMHGRLAYSPDLRMLVGLRSRILQEMKTYSLYDSVRPDSRLQLGRLVLNSL